MSVHLLTGADESLLGGAVSDCVRQLVGAGDRSLMVDDFDVAAEAFEIRSAIDAAQTSPFLTDRRVVVVRGVDKLVAEQVAMVVAYLGDPLPSTDLVLSGGGRLAKALTDAAKAAGATTTVTGAPTSKRDRGQWLDEQLAAHNLRVDAGAMSLLSGWLGEDAGRLRGLLNTLVSSFGTGTRLTANEIGPLLGDGGNIPPWDLTDAIDSGDVGLALRLLNRMLHSGERHPLAVLAILHTHYVRMLKLDGLDVRSEAKAMEVLGLKTSFQAKKAMDQYRQLSGTGVRRAMQLLADADWSMKGGTDLDAELVIEVMVARLARLTPRRGAVRR
jgi:DNA polymerase III subunit delta